MKTKIGMLSSFRYLSILCYCLNICYFGQDTCSSQGHLGPKKWHMAKVGGSKPVLLK